MGHRGGMMVLFAGLGLTIAFGSAACADGLERKPVCISAFGLETADCEAATAALVIDAEGNGPLCVGGYGHAAITCSHPVLVRDVHTEQGGVTCIGGYDGQPADCRLRPSGNIAIVAGG